MKKRVGIITLYHNSHNYGGLLQAYALVKIISKMGYIVEQIDYNGEKAPKLFLVKFKECINSRFHRCEKNNDEIPEMIRKSILERWQVLDLFREEIPHSIEYDDRTIMKSLSQYDIFVCGSDQIWNYFFNKVYYLNFVPKSKKKFSYAASMVGGNKKIKIKYWIYKSLKRLDAVSVREKALVTELSYVNSDVCCVLDPTLLLSKEEWIRFSTPIKVYKPYVFAYFLGNDKNMRNIVSIYAKKNNLSIITLPFLSNNNIQVDMNFGDIQLYSVSPRELISYIYNSTFIFTDSFHITLFANILEKQFVTFERVGKTNMNIRIESLLSIFDNRNRFLKSLEEKSINWIENLGKVKYSSYNQKLNEMKNQSFSFLERNLKKV